jgi:hypothetical protein
MLGPLEVRTDDDPGQILQVGGARLRALLIMPALRPGQLVPVSQLIDGLWARPGAGRGGERAAGPGVPAAPRPARGGDRIPAAGYRPKLDPRATDVVRFEELAAAGRAQLREDPAAAGATAARGTPANPACHLLPLPPAGPPV